MSSISYIIVIYGQLDYHKKTAQELMNVRKNTLAIWRTCGARWLACLVSVVSFGAGATDISERTVLKKSTVGVPAKSAAKPATKPKPALKQVSTPAAKPVLREPPLVKTAATSPVARSQSAPAVTKNVARPPFTAPPKVFEAPGPLAAARPSSLQIDPVAMDDQWRTLQATVRPNKLIVLCENFERDFPGSYYSETLIEILAGARRAVKAQRIAGLSSDALEENSGDAQYQRELAAATRGNHGAAFKVAQMYRDGANGMRPNTLRFSQWLRFAAELGNGVASWEVATLFNYAGRIGDAAHYEAKAIEFGYMPTKRLPSRAINY